MRNIIRRVCSLCRLNSRKCTLCALAAIPFLFFLLSPVLLQRSPIFKTTADTKCDVTADVPKVNELDSQFVSWPTAAKNQSTAPAWKKFTTALQRYSRLHKNGLEKLRTGSGSDVRTLTWACSQNSCAGLGDQFLRLQLFLLLAMVSNRVFTIYWDANLKETTKYLGHNEIDWTFFDSSLGMCSDADMTCSDRIYTTTSMFGFGWNKKELAKFGDVLVGPTQHITVTGLVYATLTLLTREDWLRSSSAINSGLEKIGVYEILSLVGENSFTVEHRTLWYSLLHAFGIHHLVEVPEINSGQMKLTEPLVHLGHTIFSYLFKISKRVGSEVAQLKTALRIQGQHYVSVHLRTGFKGSMYEESVATRWLHRNWKIFEDTDVWECIMDYSLSLADKKVGKGSPVYLSTDSDLAKKWASRKYNERIRISEGVLTHSAHTKTTCGNAQMSLWTDLLILGDSHSMIHGDSSFATVATFLFPMDLERQPLIMYNGERSCIASYVGKTVSCIC